MGIASIDDLKGAYSTATDFLCRQRVVFHHVPKCGGTSVARAIRKRYLLSQATIDPEASYRSYEAFSGKTSREALLIDVLDLREQIFLYHLFNDVRCISAHVRFSPVAHERFRDVYKFVTILREPTARFRSHYLWSHGRPGAHARIEEPLEQFLETRRARRLGATYAEFFSGLPKEADFRSREAVEAAISNLKRFNVVGRLDAIADFQRALERELGVRVRIGHENRARKPRGEWPDFERAEVKEAIAEICRPDEAVWQGVTAAQPDSGQGCF